MRNIRLQTMRIVNFKGISDLTLDFDGKNTLISGYNNTGKSTIADAYFWLVTGKNAAGAQRFEVRPRDKSGNEVHNVITTVEAVFKIDGKLDVTLRRDELEDLTDKERRELKPETIAPKKSFYFIDGAPYDQKIFYAKVALFIDCKERLMLLSNPAAFFMLKDNEQRDILTAACGDVADSEIDGYDKVQEICGAVVTPTEKRDGLQKTIKTTKKRLDEIPARVDSLLGLCSDVYADYDKQIAELQKEQEETTAQGEKLKKQAQGVSPTMLPPEPSKREIMEYEYRIKNIERSIEAEKAVLAIIEKSISKNTCPKCGYDMGSRAAEKPLCEQSILKKQNDLLIYQESLRQAQAEYDAAMQEYNAKVAEQAKADETATQERKSLETCLEKLRNRYTELSVEISKLQQAKQVQGRIKALREEQITLDGELAEDMTKLDIISEFLIRKAEAVVENINKRFKRVKFKLFDMQTNGELKPCCKALVDGVSYANTNTASKVQVGIELIKLLNKFYGRQAPVWVDDKESVIDLPETDSQIVCLKVDEQYKELQIEELRKTK